MIKVNKQAAALVAVSAAFASHSSASGAITVAVCDALIAGADVVDVLAYATEGYETNGNDLPAAYRSNIKRLAAAPLATIKKCRGSGLALNNNLMIAFDVPKRSTTGRKVGSVAKPETADKAAPDVAVPALPDTLADALQALIALRAVKPVASNMMLANALTDAIAIARQEVKAQQQRATKAAKQPEAALV